MYEKLVSMGKMSPAVVTHGLSEDSKLRSMIVIGLIALLLIVTAMSQLQRAGSASVDANSAVVAAVSDSASEEFSYYTERYWKMAEAQAAENAAATSASTTEPEYAFYTERYWKMAEAQAAENADEAEPEYAYYTERYWREAEKD